MENKHDEIIEKLYEEVKDLPILDCEDVVNLHFGLGMYIRNKYLWRNKENIEYFAQYYGVEHPDDISSCMIKELKALKALRNSPDSQQ